MHLSKCKRRRGAEQVDSGEFCGAIVNTPGMQRVYHCGSLLFERWLDSDGNLRGSAIRSNGLAVSKYHCRHRKSKSHRRRASFLSSATTATVTRRGTPTPLSIEPQPATIHRVFVGRMELLTRQRQTLSKPPPRLTTEQRLQNMAVFLRR